MGGEQRYRYTAFAQLPSPESGPRVFGFAVSTVNEDEWMQKPCHFLNRPHACAGLSRRTSWKSQVNQHLVHAGRMRATHDPGRYLGRIAAHCTHTCSVTLLRTALTVSKGAGHP